DVKSNISIFTKNAKVSGDKINITTICDKIQYKNFKRGWWKVINNKLILYTKFVTKHDDSKVYKFDSEIDWSKNTSWVRLGDGTLKYRNIALKPVDFEKGGNKQIKNFLNLYYSRNSDKKINGCFKYVIVEQPGIKDMAPKMRLINEFDPNIYEINVMHYFKKKSTFLSVCLGMEVEDMEMYIKQKIDKYYNPQTLSNYVNEVQMKIDIPDLFIHDL
ncbi:5282_t:CDS:1, partial [Dentiscutata heterogama]